MATNQGGNGLSLQQLTEQQKQQMHDRITSNLQAKDHLKGWAGALANIEDLTSMIYSVVQNKSQFKADAPFLTTTSGTFNAIYGLVPWILSNYQVSPYIISSKMPFRRTGFRSIPSKIVVNTDNGNSQYGGIAEDGQFPKLVKPPFQEHEIDPKITVIPFGDSLKQELIANSEDDTWGGIAAVRNIMMPEYINVKCAGIMRDVETEAAAASANWNYKASVDQTPYDRLVSGSDEEEQLGGRYDGWYDAYGEKGFERDANSAGNHKKLFNSTVITASPSKVIGGVDGVLNRGMITKGVAAVRTAVGRKPSVMLMDYEAKRELDHLYDGQVRFNGVGRTDIGMSVNGVTAAGGQAVHMEVSMVKGIPIIQTQWSVKKDATQIGKIFGLDLEFTNDMEPNVCHSVLLPPVYLENSPNAGAGNAWGWIGKDLIQRAAFLSMEELVIHNPRACFKITDLKARS